ncbi:glycosyl transferase [Deinococcus seoulensis]|uniref:Glycosyl transferase n=1 Tax=Deinococcus seoulensis TaxID=1837379 RepID=A0ABQ2RTQ2_9DEIO|nr:glycosyltransferase [Deinococcus seoulensis]GGR58533.1 glycosyl transferase [Deinococcus seoulensis]
MESYPLPSVDIAIPVHDGIKAQDLRECLESVKNQSYKPINISVYVDGNIRSELDDVLVEFQDSLSVNYMEKIGLSAILNYSILLSRSPYYARMDADDIMYTDRIKIQVEYLQRNPDIKILGTSFTEFTTAESKHRNMPHDHKIISEMLHYRNPFAHPTIMFRREVFKTIGLYSRNFPYAEDLELWTRADINSIKMTNLPQQLLYYRMGEMHARRNNFIAFKSEAKVRLRNSTRSPRIFLLKIIAITFRLLPPKIAKFAYKIRK